jgi:Nuclease-related domain
MRVVELSNHPGDMLNDVSQRRAAARSRALSGYEDALIQYRARVQTIRVKRDRARSQHKWWTWLRLSFGVWAEKRRVPRPPVIEPGLTDTEEKIRAGIAGEQLVAAELGRALGDDWTLLRGYRNRRGEIDDLLLGPRGLFAIEVKNINATVYIDGDRWRADKYDNYGNLVEQRPIADRKGRSPSEQLNEPADELERFLHERGQRVVVRRVVVLTHRRSKLGQSRNPTVMVGTSTGYVLSFVHDAGDELDDSDRAQIERLIRRDHDFYASRRRPGPGGRRPPARNR